MLLILSCRVVHQVLPSVKLQLPGLESSGIDSCTILDGQRPVAIHGLTQMTRAAEYPATVWIAWPSGTSVSFSQLADRSPRAGERDIQVSRIRMIRGVEGDLNEFDFGNAAARNGDRIAYTGQVIVQNWRIQQRRCSRIG